MKFNHKPSSQKVRDCIQSNIGGYQFALKMDPACIKMTVLVFLAVFAMRARSQTEHSIGSYARSETERCVCQPHVTINPPVCGRSVPVNSGTGCNCTTVQEMIRIVSDNHESVSSELRDMKRQLETLQSAVTSIVGLLTGIVT